MHLSCYDVPLHDYSSVVAAMTVEVSCGGPTICCRNSVVGLWMSPAGEGGGGGTFPCCTHTRMMKGIDVLPNYDNSFRSWRNAGFSQLLVNLT